MLTIAGETPGTLELAPVDAAGVLHRVEAGAPRRAPARGGGAGTLARNAWPACGTPCRRRASDGLQLLRRVGRIDPTSLDDYRTTGGYEALATALERGAEGVIPR